MLSVQVLCFLDTICGIVLTAFVADFMGSESDVICGRFSEHWLHLWQLFCAKVLLVADCMRLHNICCTFYSVRYYLSQNFLALTAFVADFRPGLDWQKHLLSYLCQILCVQLIFVAKLMNLNCTCGNFLPCHKMLKQFRRFVDLVSLNKELKAGFKPFMDTKLLS